MVRRISWSKRGVLMSTSLIPEETDFDQPMKSAKIVDGFFDLIQPSGGLDYALE